MLAEVAQRDVRRGIVAQQLPCRRRDEHLAAVSGRGDARSAVDAEADVPFAADGRLAGVDAHPHPQLLAAGPVMGGKLALPVEGSSDGILGAPEGREERVALRVDLRAVVVGESRPDDPLMVGEDGRVFLAQLLQQPSRPLDVGEEEGDGAGRPLGRSAHRLVVHL